LFGRITGGSVARIRSFQPSTQNIRVHPTEVDCEYLVVSDGARQLLHLNTFGSDDRESARKSSQSLQLNLDMARELVEIIEVAFPGLRGG
jgi:hypothetical protein